MLSICFWMVQPQCFSDFFNLKFYAMRVYFYPIKVSRFELNASFCCLFTRHISVNSFMSVISNYLNTVSFSSQYSLFYLANTLFHDYIYWIWFTVQRYLSQFINIFSLSISFYCYIPSIFSTIFFSSATCQQFASIFWIVFMITLCQSSSNYRIDSMASCFMSLLMETYKTSPSKDDVFLLAKISFQNWQLSFLNSFQVRYLAICAKIYRNS